MGTTHELIYTEQVNVTAVGQTVALPDSLGRTSIVGWEVVHLSGDEVGCLPAAAGTEITMPNAPMYVANSAARRRDYAHVRTPTMGLRCSAAESASVVAKCYGVPRRAF